MSEIAETAEAASQITTNTWGNNILNYLKSEPFLISIIVLFIIIASILLIGKIFRYFLRQYENRLPEPGSADPQKIMLMHVLSSAFKGVVIVVGVIFILQCNGIQVTALITSAGILSAIIGLALQDAIKDLIQGAHIIGDQYFSVGDVIRYGGVDGLVLKVTLRVTKIRDIRTNNVFTISNRNISVAEKLSHQHDIDLGLSYEDNSDRVMEVLGSICREIGQIDGVESCGLKGLQSFEGSCIVYKIRMFTKPEKMPQLHRDAMKIIRNGLEKAGIKVPFAQLDIHMNEKVK